MFLVKAEFKVHKVARKGTGGGTTRVWAAALRGAVTIARGPGHRPVPSSGHPRGWSVWVAQPSASRAQPASAGKLLSFRYERATCRAQTPAGPSCHQAQHSPHTRMDRPASPRPGARRGWPLLPASLHSAAGPPERSVMAADNLQTKRKRNGIVLLEILTVPQLAQWPASLQEFLIRNLSGRFQANSETHTVSSLSRSLRACFQPDGGAGFLGS